MKSSGRLAGFCRLSKTRVSVEEVRHTRDEWPFG